MSAIKPKLRSSIVAALVVLGTFGALALLTAGTARASSPCSITVHTENVANNAVQSAINTYPRGSICVGAGYFPEQLTISSPHTVLKGAGAASTVIEPASVTFNTYDFDSAPSPHALLSTLTPAAATILVDNTSAVTVEDLQVNGAGGSSSFSGCGDNYYGVDFENPSGSLKSSQVQNVELPAVDFGCQDGLAVYAYNGFYYSGTGSAQTVSITSTLIASYDKNGVTCDDPLETCTVSSNTINGAGGIPATAQNGIQVAYGAKGTVKSNTVYGDNFTGTTAVNDWCGAGFAAAGILLFDPGTGTAVSFNQLSGNQLGMAYVDDGVSAMGYAGPEHVTISHNTVAVSTGYGIVANGAPGGGDAVTIHSNTVNDEFASDPALWGAPGILVDTRTFTITGNHIRGSSSASGSSNGASQ